MVGTTWSRHLFAVIVAVAWLTTSAPASAESLPDPCSGTTPHTVLVHDLANTSEAWSGLSADLTTAGHCVTAFAWGRPQDGDVPIPLGGLHGVDAGAAEFAAALDGLCEHDDACSVDVIAHGAGSLVVQRYLQEHGAAHVRSLTTIGALWHGTEIGGLAATEQISRDLGTYDAVLELEKPILDPLCAGCREIITGSDLLRDLHARGIPTPGVRYTDIVSACDGLVVPAENGALPTSTVVMLSGTDSTGCVDHWALPGNPVVRAAVIEALPSQDM